MSGKNPFVSVKNSDMKGVPSENASKEDKDAFRAYLAKYGMRDVEEYLSTIIKNFATKGTEYANLPRPLKKDISEQTYKKALKKAKEQSKKPAEEEEEEEDDMEGVGVVVPLKKKITRDPSDFSKQDDGSVATKTGSTTPNSDVSIKTMGSLAGKVKAGESIMTIIIREMDDTDVGEYSSNNNRYQKPGADLQLTTAELLSYISMFQYIGFNPEITWNKLCALAEAAGLSGPDFYKDMAGIIVFFLSRGTRIFSAKMLNKTSIAGRKALAELVKRYKIIKGSPTKLEDITVARIAAVFVKQVYLLNHYDFARIVGQVPEGFPKSMCFSMMPSILKRNSAYTDEIFDLWVEWSTSQSLVLKKNRLVTTKIDEDKVREAQKQFGKIMMDSNWIPNDERTIGTYNLNVEVQRYQEKADATRIEFAKYRKELKGSGSSGT